MSEIEPVIAHAIEEYGGLDILCNVAGIPGSLVALTGPTEASSTIDRRKSPRRVPPHESRHPAHDRSGWGAIVNVASTAALIGTPSLSAYAASKAGVVVFTKVAAVEYGKQGIRVNGSVPA